ncbi:MAG TPA: hypothetical protein VFV01_26855 [Spirillospora sp.]|nr:hypothetical protein [Spirillospora sp.]
MNKILETLAVPWTKRWSGQVAAAALVFWTIGLYAWLTRLPSKGALCHPHDGPALDLWCRAGQVGVAGRAVMVVFACALVVGSALTVTAATPRIVHLAVGDGRGFGRLGRAAGPVTRWLLRRQVARRRRAASAGRPVPLPAPPPVRRAVEKRTAMDALTHRIGQSAIAGLRRYPFKDEAMAPTRIGCALAAMVERVRRRHGLDLPVCWETLLAVLPPDARARLAAASGRVLLRAQVMVWTVLTALWAPALHGWVVPALPVAAIAMAVVLSSGLRESFEGYCDLIEALVALHRSRLYTGLGMAVPPSLAEERVAGAELSSYLAGWRFDHDAPLSWPAPDPPPPVTVNVNPNEGTS